MKTDIRTAWAKIVAKSNDDIEFRKELLANPDQVMKDYGIDVPANINVNIIEQKSANDVYMVLPVKGFEVLNDSFLKEISAGVSIGEIVNLSMSSG